MIESYQRSTIPNQYNLRLVEFYGGEEWRKNKGAELKICIQRIVEAELEDEYQRNSEPSEEVRRALEERVEKNEKTKEEEGNWGSKDTKGGERNLKSESTTEREGKSA